MANVTTTEAEEVYDGTVTDAAVEAAAQISDALLSDCGYTTDQRKLIDKWLASHFQAILDGDNSITSISQSKRSKSKADIFGKNLESTEYGQMALSVDTCGELKNAGKQKATFNVL